MVLISLIAVALQLMIVRKWQAFVAAFAVFFVLYISSFSSNPIQRNPLFWLAVVAWCGAWLCIEKQPEAAPASNAPKKAQARTDEAVPAWSVEAPLFDINSPIEADINSIQGDHLAMPKLDGIFARWVPSAGLFTKNGRRITCLAHIEQALKNSPLAHHVADGEIYSHGLAFEKINGLVRCAEANADHLALSFNAFDLPEMPGSNATTQQALTKLLPHDAEHLKRVPVQSVSGADAAQAYQEQLTAGYEGLILRGEGNSVYKIKPLKDAEARLIGFTPAKTPGQPFNGLVLEMADGKTFKVSNLKAAQRAALFAAGANGQLVTYSYQSLTAKGLPRFARLKDQRFDMTLTTN